LWISEKLRPVEHISIYFIEAVRIEEGRTQRVSDSRCALGTSSVRADNNGILVSRDVERDVPLQKPLGIEVVYWNIKEALVLAVMEVTMESVSNMSLSSSINDTEIAAWFASALAHTG
jgi:hypothetical protein